VLATKYSFNQRPGDPNAGGNHRKNMTQALEAACNGSARITSTFTGCTPGMN